MKTLLFCLLNVLAFILGYGQEVSLDYYTLMEKADSLYFKSNYENAATAYREAMTAFNGKALPNDRYKAACAWSRAAFADSAFHYLNLLAAEDKFSYYSMVAKEAAFVPLHTDSRWKVLLEKIKNNKTEFDKKWAINCTSNQVADEVASQSKITAYQLNVWIDTELKKVRVKGFIDVDFQDEDSIELILWGKSTINQLEYNGQDMVYYFDTINKSAIIYIPDGRNLILYKPLLVENNIKVYVDYECDMNTIFGWGRSFTEGWIEIGYYTAWYPVNKNSRDFTAELQININSPYRISGSGLVTETEGKWLMSQQWNGAFDMVIIASKELKSKTLELENATIEAVYTSFPEADIDSVLHEFKKVYNFYEQLYGSLYNSNNQYSKFVINPLKGGGGYSRKNYITLKSQRFDESLSRGIAHEMAHFWWNEADTNTWQDWLNEAFAEYSTLLYVKAKWGEKIFNSYIDAYEVNAGNSCPIWGIDRAKPEAYTALYEKGALILNELEQQIGSDKFFGFINELLRINVKTTDDFLNLMQNYLGENARDWMEEKLKMKNYTKSSFVN